MALPLLALSMPPLPLPPPPPPVDTALDIDQLTRVRLAASRAQQRQTVLRAGVALLPTVDVANLAHLAALDVYQTDTVYGPAMLCVTMAGGGLAQLPPIALPLELETWRTAFLKFKAGEQTQPTFPESAWLGSWLADKARNPFDTLRGRARDRCEVLMARHTREEFAAAGVPAKVWDELQAKWPAEVRDKRNIKNDLLGLGRELYELDHPADDDFSQVGMLLCMVGDAPHTTPWRLRSMHALVATNCAHDCIKDSLFA